MEWNGIGKNGIEKNIVDYLNLLFFWRGMCDFVCQ
jgi:hypothetical protein